MGAVSVLPCLFVYVVRWCCVTA